MHGIELMGNTLCKITLCILQMGLVLTCKMLPNHFKEFNLWPSAYLALHFMAIIKLEVLNYSE